MPEEKPPGPLKLAQASMRLMKELSRPKYVQWVILGILLQPGAPTRALELAEVPLVKSLSFPVRKR